MTSADTKARDIAPVKPSSRDPIAQWLDVFTSLLALPAGESERIRDELEDHLRTRVDDLLILGMSEPEAVQKAVTELGETAQLARNFKAVRTHSRRRIAMHTALFAAAGLALTVSVAGFLPQTSRAPIDQSAVIVDAQPEGEHHNGMLDRDLPEGTLGDMLQMLADAGNARLFVHWGSLEPMGLGPETEIRAIPAKGLEHGKVRQLINSALGLEGADELTARMDGNLVEIGSQTYFDRVETITIDHDISKLVRADHVLEFTEEASNLRNGLCMVIEPDVWDNGLGSVAVNGPILSIRAPQRVQVMVIDYIARLEAAQKRMQDGAAMQELKDREEAKASQEAALKQSIESRNRLISELEVLQAQLDEFNVEYWRNDYRLKELEAAYQNESNEALKSERLEELVQAGARSDSLNAKRNLLDQQIGSKRSAIAASENNLSYLQAVVSEGGRSSGR